MSADSTNPIRAAMEAQNKTQADVATALGVSRQAVQKWTTGGTPDTRELEALSAILGSFCCVSYW